MQALEATKCSLALQPFANLTLASVANRGFIVGGTERPGLWAHLLYTCLNRC